MTVELAEVGGFITVNGSPEFVARVGSDLEALRASPHGQQMLAALRNAHDASSTAFWPGLGVLVSSGHTLSIEETAAENGFAHADQSLAGTRATRIEYNPAFQGIVDGPPITVLYHELAHVDDYMSDTVAPGTHPGRTTAAYPTRSGSRSVYLLTTTVTRARRRGSTRDTRSRSPRTHCARSWAWCGDRGTETRWTAPPAPTYQRGEAGRTAMAEGVAAESVAELPGLLRAAWRLAWSANRRTTLVLVGARLASGRPVEFGDHTVLMNVDGLYATLFTLQASSYHAGKEGEMPDSLPPACDPHRFE